MRVVGAGDCRVAFGRSTPGVSHHTKSTSGTRPLLHRAPHSAALCVEGGNRLVHGGPTD
jgi:hypothetical protein